MKRTSIVVTLLLATVLCAHKIAAVPEHVVCEECKSPTIRTNVTLDTIVHPDSIETIADVYGCFEGQPLVVLFPGFAQDKERYSMFATEMARKFNVIVPYHGVTLSGSTGPALNLVSPPVLNQAIEWAKTQGGSIDVKRTSVIGHSFGAAQVIYALQGVCQFPYCPTPSLEYKLPVELKVATAWAYSVVSNTAVDDTTPIFLEGVNNNGFPYYWANGSGDTFGRSAGQGTFDRMVATKAYSVMDNLDHFSIANGVYFDRKNEVLSTRERKDQVEEVAKTLTLWIEEQLNGYQVYSFCNKLFKERDSTLSCEEDFSHPLESHDQVLSRKRFQDDVGTKIV